ncbi:MAG: hypothetical protein IJ177_00725 [Fibrobacter sp.]|uniref:FISUMP domain-containing protein n=1 Tax=Fibrobacter sp. TaxID=35828 RepID=UPI0025B88789|nr:FISUMP domain-containing protein [Fibrobacter sp.]MBQ9224703.1 hypothetical protein [Fibrobacter sp.]
MHFLFALLLAFFVVACGDDESSFAPRDDEPTSSSSESVTPQSSSSVRSSSSAEPALSSAEGVEDLSSSSVRSSSSSVTPKSSSSVRSSSSTPVEDLSSSSAKSSSSSVSSSSEYVPFDHSDALAEDWRIGENRYKTFTDPRNGRSYYYITIYSEYKGYSVTVMAENLNIGDMVLGENDQNDDTKIERYCYNNDTTKCDEFGGLYQWAEMMQLPSECNTKSCADQIKPNHQGICPDGWRLFTYDDYCVVRGYKDEYDDGIKGLRSMHGFSGTNSSGFSLTGAGKRTKKGGFDSLKEDAYWYLPEEYEGQEASHAYFGVISSFTNDAPSRINRDLKRYGFSVRCVMVENQAE